jgi:hypothetical protein
MTTTQRVNLVRNAEEHIRALTAVIDLLVQSPDCQHELVVISRALSRLAFRAQPHDFGNIWDRLGDDAFECPNHQELFAEVRALINKLRG